ncbi:hypothetical protein SDC9_84564 [bioreactor metagenome]|uniref:Uncharacterized protein n=1 Tax=bioreactor metagenome TaxID=1076179 RepID=A0A644ZAN7_9ZZZZ
MRQDRLRMLARQYHMTTALIFKPTREIISMEQQALTLHICGLSVRISFAPEMNLDVLDEAKQILLTHYEQGAHA